MIREASVTGLLRTIFVVVGVFVLLRFIGRLMIAKRSMEMERQRMKKEKAFENAKAEKLKNFGKTKVVKPADSKFNSSSAEDVDFEIVDK